MKYIEHELSISQKWKEDLYQKIEFFANNRANKYINHHMYEDISQEARVGAWNAINSFDYRKNFDFYRWAQWNISKEIRRILLEDKRDKKNKKNFKKNEKYLNVDNFIDILTIDKVFGLASQLFSKKENAVFINNIVEGMTLAETGSIIGLTAERVRQIRQNVLLKVTKIIEKV